jgi:hypothetical protein
VALLAYPPTRLPALLCLGRGSKQIKTKTTQNKNKEDKNKNKKGKEKRTS